MSEPDDVVARLRCCANPVIGSSWTYGLGGETPETLDCVVLRISSIHCTSCGTDYHLDVDEPLHEVNLESLAMRIVPVRRRPS